MIATCQRPTKRVPRAALACALLLTACDGGEQQAGAGDDTPATATVQVAPARHEAVVEDLRLYGTVVPGPAASHTVSVPYESRVQRLLVREGEQVDAGDPLVEVAPSPDTRLASSEARAAVEAAERTLEAVRRRHESRLATNQDLFDAEQAVRSARLRMRSLAGRGAGRPQTIPAVGPAVVSTVHVTEGSVVPAGQPIVALALRDHREVRFGLEVEDAHRASPNDTVTVSDLGTPPAVRVDGTVRAVAETVDPRTRLVDLYVALPAAAELMFGQRVAGTLRIQGSPATVVPRAALVPQDDELIVFTVEDGHAVEHVVRVGLETDDSVELLDGDISEGDHVVVVGAPVLEDGMPVRVEDGS